MSKVRTRYAPSPTGKFHIGGARTALFNYLYAKHNSGEFIVRIEDTDVERNVEGGIESQFSCLKWLNIFADESIESPTKHGPYIQSMKFDVYKKYAYELLNKKLAYRCFCTADELTKAREMATLSRETPKYSRKCYKLSESEIQSKLNQNIPYAIRLHINQENEYRWIDLIRGEMVVPASSMTDPVILKSNQIATYNFAVVIDDHDMNITHILRGEEHISNTPYQIAIKEALGFDDAFNYGHLSIIIDESGKKLSKRNLDIEQFIEGFMHKGYLSNALVNFIALLGWSDPDNNEILSMNDLIKKFSIDRISLAPAFFDIKKLNWISNEYFKKMDNEIYSKFILPFIKIDNPLLFNKEDKLALFFKKNLHFASEINELIKMNFLSDFSWQGLNENAKNLIINSEKNKSLFITLLDKFSNILEWNEINIKQAIKETGIEQNISGKDLFMPIRLLMTGNEHGPELAIIISIYDKSNVLKIIQECISNLN
ncbi:glutamate--tRNA ligase [Mycoplasmoides alvi]|uniref:glutamate--tRNA ligase n=1 Tax=Mycoplasmoides alvi TaxID=78580 RepID=UPI00051AC5F1|nr:glutamate--tRNA ligase [Mycoplasmoides alvi]